MKKIARANLILDKLHKGVVCVCMAVTVYGFSHLGYRWFRYFTVLRPEEKRRELMAQENLLAEGSSDILKDSAQDLKL